MSIYIYIYICRTAYHSSCTSASIHIYIYIYNMSVCIIQRSQRADLRANRVYVYIYIYRNGCSTQLGCAKPASRFFFGNPCFWWVFCKFPVDFSCTGSLQRCQCWMNSRRKPGNALYLRCFRVVRNGQNRFEELLAWYSTVFQDTCDLSEHSSL